MQWEEIGSGTYNKAYINEHKTLVLKIQHSEEHKTDRPERSVRLWNEINCDLFPKAYLASTAYRDGWICPYIEGVQSSDTEIAQMLLDLYSRTGRVVIDAPAPKNFIKTNEG